jgi:Zn ribbon nucleic-acid-binding protein
MEGTRPPCERRDELFTWKNNGVPSPDTAATVTESDSESKVTRHANAAGVKCVAIRL